MDRTFIPIHVLAQLTGLPEGWLRGETEAGRIPHIRVGRRLMFHFETAEKALLAHVAGSALDQSAPRTPSRECP